jgi:predicted phage terminase large subunit-like protein
MMVPLELTDEDIALLLANVDQLSPEERHELDEITETLERRKRAALCRDDLLEFCKTMQPDYKVGAHHRALAKLLMQIEKGEKDRISVSIAPRHGKSQLTSIYFAAWFIGRNPAKKIIMVSHTTDLAVDFGRKVRNIIDTPAYKEVFTDVTLAPDSKSAGRWNTNHLGEFFACGIGSSLAGRGADLLLIDDPHSEQDVLAGNYSVFDKAYEWFTFGARTRLMPQGRVAIVATRWHQDDLIGRMIRDMTNNPVSDQYEVVEFPAILHEGTGDEKALWPEFFDLPALKRTKASMPLYQWEAQYQQRPTGKEAAIVQKEWWRRWRKSKPPVSDYIIMCLDAASETHNRADFTAITTWGVFFNEEESLHNVILLNAIQERMQFPELKKKALEEYREWEPDAFIVEKKSAGTPLYQELRRLDIPVQEYTPHRGSGDKIARLNSVADIIKSGLVWVPDLRWADTLVEETAAFPNGSHDDLVDTMIMALMRFRSGGFLVLPTDAKDEPLYTRRRRAAYY